MYYLEKFNIGIHMDTLGTWLKARNSYIPTVSEMPELGFVVYFRGEPIAMASIRRIEGGFAELDGLVSNPAAESDMRNQAIDLVVEQVLKTTKELGIKQLKAFTSDENTLLRASKFGFVKHPHTLITWIAPQSQ